MPLTTMASARGNTRIVLEHSDAYCLAIITSLALERAAVVAVEL